MFPERFVCVCDWIICITVHDASGDILEGMVYEMPEGPEEEFLINMLDDMVIIYPAISVVTSLSYQGVPILMGRKENGKKAEVIRNDR